MVANGRKENKVDLLDLGVWEYIHELSKEVEKNTKKTGWEFCRGLISMIKAVSKSSKCRKGWVNEKGGDWEHDEDDDDGGVDEGVVCVGG